MSGSTACVRNFFELVLKVETTEECFSGFIIESMTSNELKICNYEEKMRHLIKELESNDSINHGIREYIDLTSSMMTKKKVNILLSMLEYAINNNLLQAIVVCELILGCENLVCENEVFFVCSFELIRRVISLADYKGVRNCLKIIIEKVLLVPHNANISIYPQLDVMYQVLEYIMDRKSCLLPAYLVLDEIQKKISYHIPHWKFSKLLASFVNSFRPVAQMVSVANCSKILPIVGYSSTVAHAWRLDPNTGRFLLKGLLPYSKDLLSPQLALIRYVLEQPASKDMICAMLNLNGKEKVRCQILEQQIVELIISAMERSENENEDENASSTLSLWQLISFHLIQFFLLSHISFSHLLHSLIEKLSSRPLRKGREHLMWVLLQILSGSIQKYPLSDFLPLLKLYDLLYPEKEPFPVPDVTKPSCTRIMAPASIWLHLMKKADPQKLQRPIPQALKLHVEYLQQNLMANGLSGSLSTDYKVALLCNAYSINSEYFARPMGILVEALQGRSHGNGAVPLTTTMLDSLTVHTKMSLIRNIVNYINKFVANKPLSQPAMQPQPSLPPALIETYSRLLIYNEIEALGFKGFLSSLLGGVRRHEAWNVLHSLLEMFTYRLHHVSYTYRVQVLGYLHQLSNVLKTNSNQLVVCIENAALKLILGLSCGEVLMITQFSRVQSEALISLESEELNKVLVLTFARAIHVTGSESFSAVAWIKELLSNISNNTPLVWSSNTLAFFPPTIAEHFNNTSSGNGTSIANANNKDNKGTLKRWIDEEYRKWITMSNESDMCSHFGTGNHGLFLCLCWKMFLENGEISPVAYKILERIGTKDLSPHLRILCNYLVCEFANLIGGQSAGKYVDKLNDFIWKCNVVTLERFLLCLTLRAFEGNEAQVAMFIIQMLLLKTNEFLCRVNDFVRDIPPEHWKQSNYHEKHVAFHMKYPEQFSPSQNEPLYPSYFSNICLRFLPILDLIIHRYLELPTTTTSLDSLLDKYGVLYRYHDYPITYLYDTLHYYGSRLGDKYLLRRKLLLTIMGHCKPGLSDQYKEGWRNISDVRSGSHINNGIIIDSDYYIKIVSRLVDGSNCDNRFGEFINSGVGLLLGTAVELMGLPVSPEMVGNGLIDLISSSKTCGWVGVVGALLMALPQSYWGVVFDRVVTVLQQLKDKSVHFMDLVGPSIGEGPIGYLVSLVHSVLFQASFGQISLLPTFLRERVRPIVSNESQLLFVLHLVCPFLQRLYKDRTRIMMDTTIELYELLAIVDASGDEMKYDDVICDLFYHIKYMFAGDTVKQEVEGIVRGLQPGLRRKLRFIGPYVVD